MYELNLSTEVSCIFGFSIGILFNFKTLCKDVSQSSQGYREAVMFILVAQDLIL